METKIVRVFYDIDNLPYKDKECSIHFPVIGSAFLGASNTTKIRFYYSKIGNEDVTWVSIAKLPNGKQGSKVLPKASDEFGDYAELQLSNWYTQAKGDVFIALQGYQGGVEVQIVNGVYQVVGTPTIQTTGAIKLAINYAPIGQVADYSDEFTTYQQILALVGEIDDSKQDKAILVLNSVGDSFSITQSNFNYINKFPSYMLIDNQLYVHCEDDNNYLWFRRIRPNYVGTNGTTNMVLREESIQVSKVETLTRPCYKVNYNTNFYNKSQSDTLLAAKEDLSNKVTELSGSSTDTQYPSAKVVWDNLSALQNYLYTYYYTKTEVDNLISSFKENEISVVDTTTYPTLNDFLATTGDEGYIYLYPIDTTDLTKGYYRYVWENNSWLALGTTEIDLTDYATKTYVDNALVSYYTSSQIDTMLAIYVPKTRTIAGIDLADDITKDELNEALEVNVIEREIDKLYEDFYVSTDNLIDISIVSDWYEHNYGGSQRYAIHSQTFVVSQGDIYYLALKNVDTAKFGSQFRLIVEIIDGNGTVVATETSYASGSTSMPHKKITVPSGGVGLIATLSTRDYDIPLTINDILSSSMVAYVGKKDIVATELYNKYVSPTPTLLNDVSTLKKANIVSINWQNATIDGGTGRIYYRADRICSGMLPANISSFEVLNGYNGLVGYYNEAMEKISVGSFTKNLKVDKSSFPSGTSYLAIALNNSTSSIATSEGVNCVVYYSVEDINNDKDDFPYSFGSTNQVARLGWSVYAKTTPPEQSLPSYALAYKNGCRIMLCDVRLTADGKFVCFHDDDLGYSLSTNIVKHADGTDLSTAEKQQTIASLTLAELDVYDFGIYKGNEYAGTKILRLDDFLQWCAFTNCYPMLETKVTFTEAQIQEIAGMCKKYQLMERVIIADGYTSLPTTKSWWIANFPKCICVVRGAQSDFANRLLDAITFVNAGIETYMYFTDTTLFSDEYLNQMYNNGIGVGYSEIETETAMLNFYNSGYVGKTRLIASSYLNIQQWLLKKINVK